MIKIDWFSFILGVALANGIYLIGQIYATYVYKSPYSEFIEKGEEQ